jgi:plastocyanin
MKKSGGSKNRILTGMSILLVIFIISNSCSKSMSDMYGMGNGNGSGNNGTPGTNEVWIQGMAFSPSTITVLAGTTITWTNKDAVAHTVTSTTSLFNSGSVSGNSTYSHSFATTGTYPYKCSFHAGMTGTVIVN